MRAAATGLITMTAPDQPATGPVASFTATSTTTANMRSAATAAILSTTKSLFGSPAPAVRRQLVAQASSERRSHIVTELCECVRDIMAEFALAAREDRALLNGTSTDHLCVLLEAVFIHGLRDTFLERMSSVLGDSTRCPQPNFWPALLLITHSVVIDQINKMSQLHTDIGKCRAWLRVALNDGLLTSYLKTIMANGGGREKRTAVSLHFYYDRHALLRSPEQLDIICRQLGGMEATHTFKLAANSCLLNSWLPDPLILGGVETGAVIEPRAPLVVAGVDAAATIEEPVRAARPLTAKEKDDLQRREKVLGRTPSLILNALDPDSALDLIVLRKTPSEPSVASTSDYPASLSSKTAGEPKDGGENVSQKPQQEEQSYVSLLQSYRAGSPRARSLMQTPELSRVMFSNSSSPSSDVQHTQGSCSSSVVSVDVTAQSLSKSSETSPSADTVPIAGNTDTPSPSAVDCQLTVEVSDEDDDGIADDEEESMDPEAVERRRRHRLATDIQRRCTRVTVTPPMSPTPTAIPEPPPLYQLACSPGLHAQNYRCADCNCFIGMLYCTPRVCAVDALYYCGDCHSGGRRRCVVPSRLLNNWDFGEYSVSERSWKRVQRAHFHCTYNIYTLNPTLYNVDLLLERSRLLRTQVLYLYAFLRTCSSAVTALQNMKSSLISLHAVPATVQSESGDAVTPVEFRPSHLWRHLHRYSLADLMSLRAGAMTSLLQRVVVEARAHVLACVGCSQKGFVCEVCREARIIYPFDLSTTGCCGECGVVLHRRCWQQVHDVCPRCERRKRRQSLCEQQMAVRATC